MDRMTFPNTHDRITLSKHTLPVQQFQDSSIPDLPQEAEASEDPPRERVWRSELLRATETNRQKLGLVCDSFLQRLIAAHL